MKRTSPPAAMQVGMAQASPASKDGIMLMHWVGLLLREGASVPLGLAIPFCPLAY